MALQIVIDQTLGLGKVGDQLLMGIFEGGIGKSRLIDSIRLWFRILGHSSELNITATTGTAAFKIESCTLHSAIGIPLDRSQSANSCEEADASRERLSLKKVSEWRDRKYILVNEVSMMDAKVITKMHTQLSVITGKPDLLFGGLNLIFLEDFLQFPAVSHLDLFELISRQYGTKVISFGDH